jgi:hypothetical protein
MRRCTLGDKIRECIPPLPEYVGAIKESKMKKCLFLLLPVGIVPFIAVGVSAGNLETKGKAWLDAHHEAATINVNGDWHAKEWGKIVLNQAQGSRDVTGRGDG